ncbi:MAG: hypothetical protein RDV41_02800 [Planctomycetota bacterium]|nr:hypothetical protein [Planctomycetota bacterium]
MEPKVGCLGLLALLSGALSIVWFFGEPPGSYPVVWPPISVLGTIIAFYGMTRLLGKQTSLRMRFRNPRAPGAKSFVLGFVLIATAHTGLLIDARIWVGRTPETLGDYLTWVIAFFWIMEFPIALSAVIPLVRNILAARVVSIAGVELTPPSVQRGKPLTVKLSLQGGPGAGRTIDIDACVRSFERYWQQQPKGGRMLVATKLTEDSITIAHDVKTEPRQITSVQGDIIVPANSKPSFGNPSDAGIAWYVEIRLRIQGAPDWIESHDFRVY